MYLAIRPTHVHRKLRSHTQRVTQLRLASTELSKGLSDGLALNTTCKKHGTKQKQKQKAKQRIKFLFSLFFLEQKKKRSFSEFSIPPKSLSSSALPVVTLMTLCLLTEYSMAVMKPVSTILAAASLILSTFASEIPLMLARALRVIITTP